MHRFLVLVAGGSGSRMKSTLPKQFLLIDGKPIILHSIEKFIETIESIQIVLVLQKNEWDRWEKIRQEHSFTYPILLAEAGATRFASVQAGLNKLQEKKGIVAIHDAVRPLVSKQCILNCFELASKTGNAIPVIELKDSIRILEEKGNSAIDRKNFRLVQTPQCFELSQLKQAYAQANSENFTDDASLFESSGHELHLTEGDDENFKITTQLDFELAKLLLTKNSN